MIVFHPGWVVRASRQPVELLKFAFVQKVGSGQDVQRSDVGLKLTIQSCCERPIGFAEPFLNSFAFALRKVKYQPSRE
jgi:hypothetical protein